MAVKKKGTARRKQREQRKVSKAARHAPKKISKAAPVARRIRRGPAMPVALPQSDGDSRPLDAETNPGYYDNDAQDDTEDPGHPSNHG